MSKAALQLPPSRAPRVSAWAQSPEIPRGRPPRLPSRDQASLALSLWQVLALGPAQAPPGQGSRPQTQSQSSAEWRGFVEISSARYFATDKGTLLGGNCQLAVHAFAGILGKTNSPDFFHDAGGSRD